ncbi:DUF6414 family protein [Candidatus Clostridium radicumherbarum]|uniref:Uncharacterized protein n=1 Tax=Candidatus Clostridium radicumherbarum TaxID=3381662 RepID=A0ABW8TX33_9CLOT
MVNGIPIYVNQDLVLDLTALMFGGFEESRDVRNRGMIEDIVLNTNSSNIVLTVDLNDFSNKNAYVYDLAHSELRVLGKVSRIVDENNYFDLLRKTATSDYYNRFLESLAPYLEVLNINGILVPDEFTTKVNGPGLIVIPIAIYV